jgi:PTS system mannose-specific IIB component
VIALVRVDNRLVHGQVLETWIPRLRIARLVVADDEAARTPLARAAMTLALPAELPADVLPVEAVDFAALAAAPEAVLVLFREVEGLSRAAARGLTPARAPRVNLGNVHFAPGRRPVGPSVFLREEELAQVKALAAAGFEIEARAIPSDSPAGVAELERRWQSAG